MPKFKRNRRRGTPWWPELEDQLKKWVIEERRIMKNGITLNDIKLKGTQIAKQNKIDKFTASNGWLEKFMKRNRLSVRRNTSIGQHLPIDWQEKCASFLLFIKTNSFGIPFDLIGNMDEVPCTFDIPHNRTVDEIGTEDISVSTTGHDKTCFTIVLCVTANGKKLKPMIILKRKTIPKEDYPRDVIVRGNQKGWMNSEMMRDWLESVWKPKIALSKIFNQKSIIILDSARAHLTEAVKTEINNYSIPAVIPGGLTKILQPIDLSVNKSFKDKLRMEWNKWMKNGQHEFTPSGRTKRASLSEVCKWVSRSWNAIEINCVKNGFKKSKIYEAISQEENITCDFEIGDNVNIVIDENESENNEIDDLNAQMNDLSFIDDENFDDFNY